MDLPGFGDFEFSSRERSFTVYTRGRGLGILVMHEVPGITPEVAAFAMRLADAGFTLWMPNLFGTPGEPFSRLRVAEEFADACLHHQFKCLAEHESSPVADTLRDLGRRLFAETGGKGIGAIGMCITGNFALALMADEFVLAPVLAQPALPISTTEESKEALHISGEQLAIVKKRVAEGIVVLGLRFSADTKCPKERFRRLHAELGPGFQGIEIDSEPGNEFGIDRHAHSVLTHDFVDQEGHPTKQALDSVLDYFRGRLT